MKNFMELLKAYEENGVKIKELENWINNEYKTIDKSLNKQAMEIIKMYKENYKNQPEYLEIKKQENAIDNEFIEKDKILKHLYAVKKCLINNMKIVWNIENVHTICEVLNKYSGKNIGEKRKDEINNILMEKLNCRVWFNNESYKRWYITVYHYENVMKNLYDYNNSHELHFYNCNDFHYDNRVSIFDENGKLNSFNPENFDYRTENYIDDTENYITEKKNSLQPLRKRLMN